jgi:hypothetical protein
MKKKSNKLIIIMSVILALPPSIDSGITLYQKLKIMPKKAYSGQSRAIQGAYSHSSIIKKLKERFKP